MSNTLVNLPQIGDDVKAAFAPAGYRPLLSAIQQSGATDGQVPIWSQATNAWVPASASAASIPGAVPTLTYSYTYGLGDQTSLQALKLTGGIASVYNSASVGQSPQNPCIVAVRDCRNATDTGLNGQVNTALFAHTVTKNGTQASYEWNATFINDILANGGGEHVGMATVTNAYGNSAAWGSLLQVNDYRFDVADNLLMWGAEIGCHVSGNGKPYSRGITVVANDSKKEYTGVASLTTSTVATGIMLEGANGAVFNDGFHARNFVGNGLYSEPLGSAANGLYITGTYSSAAAKVTNAIAPIGIDLVTNNTFSDASIALSSTGKIKIGSNYLNASGSTLQWNGVAVGGGSSVPGITSTLTWWDSTRTTVNSTQLLKLTGGVISALNGIDPSVHDSAGVFVRDCRGTSGVSNYVGIALQARSATNNVQQASEWGFLSCVDNNSANGLCSAVSVYGQANNLGQLNSGSWGGIFESTDMTYGAYDAQQYGLESKIFVSGNKSSAYGLYVECGDSKYERTGVSSSDARAAAGIMIAARTTNSRVKVGIWNQAYSDTGVLLVSPGTYSGTGAAPVDGYAVQGVHSNSLFSGRFGSSVYGLDLSNSNSFSSGLATNISSSHAYGVAGTAVLKRQASGWAKVTGGMYRNPNGGDTANDSWGSVITTDPANIRGFLIQTNQVLWTLINDLRFHGIIGGNPNSSGNASFQTPP